MAITVGEQFIIHRPCEFNNFPERFPIILGRGRAFGSGEHETTRSCLEELEKLSITGYSHVMDVGCGSGILAIAAARMGAAKVVAFDPDRNAIKTALFNVVLNRVKNVVNVFQGEMAALRQNKYSLIVANLYGDILVKLIPDLSRMLYPDAFILLSGILYEYVFDIKSKASVKGLDLIKAHYLEEYVTMVFRRREDRGNSDPRIPN